MKFKASAGEKIGMTINYIVLIIFLFAVVYPFYYIFIYSISDPIRAQIGVYLFPVGLSFKTYLSVFALENILNSLFISIARTVIGTIVTTFCCMLFAFILTQKKLFLRKSIYRFLIITMYINGGLIPYYIIIRLLGLKDNFLVYILPNAIAAFFVVLAKTFIEQLPQSLQESAMIDGASPIKICLFIIFPVSMPIIATIAVFTAVNQWNSWMDSFLFITDKKLYTLQYMLYNYLREAEQLAESMRKGQSNRILIAAQFTTPQAIKMCLTMVVTIPIFLVYPYMQRYFVKGIMIGAIKG